MGNRPSQLRLPFDLNYLIFSYLPWKQKDKICPSSLCQNPELWLRTLSDWLSTPIDMLRPLFGALQRTDPDHLYHCSLMVLAAYGRPVIGNERYLDSTYCAQWACRFGSTEEIKFFITLLEQQMPIDIFNIFFLLSRDLADLVNWYLDSFSVLDIFRRRILIELRIYQANQYHVPDGVTYLELQHEFPSEKQYLASRFGHSFHDYKALTLYVLTHDYSPVWVTSLIKMTQPKDRWLTAAFLLYYCQSLAALLPGPIEFRAERSDTVVISLLGIEHQLTDLFQRIRHPLETLDFIHSISNTALFAGYYDSLDKQLHIDITNFIPTQQAAIEHWSSNWDARLLSIVSDIVVTTSIRVQIQGGNVFLTVSTTTGYRIMLHLPSALESSYLALLKR